MRLRGTRAIALMILAASSFGCRDDSRATDGSLAKVTIEIRRPVREGVLLSPARDARARANRGRPSALDAPASVADFNCFGVNVAGEGIAKKREASACSTIAALDLGIYSTIVPAAGGTIELLVPVGAARTFQVYGFTASSACPSVDDVIENRAGSGITSAPYEIGRRIETVSGETTVQITGSYVAANAKRAFCSPFDGAVASGTWDEGKWDEATWSP